MRELFELLQLNGINIKRKKCTFAEPEVRYLGHIVNSRGIRPLPSRVQDLVDFPVPDSKLSVIFGYGQLLP